MIKYRCIVELEWLKCMAGCAGLPEVAGGRGLTPPATAALARIAASLDTPGPAARVKAIEATTNHDVKAVEYFLKEEFAASGVPQLVGLSEFLHFAATSEDVNNLAYALAFADARRTVLLPAMRRLVDRVVAVAEGTAGLPLLSRTHGQAATPTTMGKEWANFAYRLSAHADAFEAVSVVGKWNGAVGNFNAHVVAYPGVDFPALARQLVEGQLGLAYNPYSTQVGGLGGEGGGESNPARARCPTP